MDSLNLSKMEDHSRVNVKAKKYRGVGVRICPRHATPRHKANLLSSPITIHQPLTLFLILLLSLYPYTKANLHSPFPSSHCSSPMASLSLPNHYLPTLLRSHSPNYPSSQNLPLSSTPSNSQFFGLKLSHSPSSSIPSSSFLRPSIFAKVHFSHHHLFSCC